MFKTLATTYTNNKGDKNSFAIWAPYGETTSTQAIREDFAKTWQELPWQERNAKLGILQFNVGKAHQHKKPYADKERKEDIFEVGKMVSKGIQGLGQMVYKLELPMGCQVYSDFHMFQFKSVESVIKKIRLTTLPLSADLELLDRPTDDLWERQEGVQMQEVLVSRGGSEESEATRESTTENFKADSKAHLEDKVLNLAGGIVTPMEEGTVNTHVVLT